MKGCIDVGAVVCAHGKGGEVIKVACICGIQDLFLRPGIAGIDGAGKNLLGDIVNFHDKSSVWMIKLS
jgi:hypothetical protein